MADELQAPCFLAGANSIFIGDVLQTTRNLQRVRDTGLRDRVGITSAMPDQKKALSGSDHISSACEMEISVLEVRIHRATVTQSDLHFEGAVSNIGSC
ncbi:hypothetical protein ABH995_000868 [Bradyrhizobium yuanmingense]